MDQVWVGAGTDIWSPSRWPSDHDLFYLRGFKGHRRHSDDCKVFIFGKSCFLTNTKPPPVAINSNFAFLSKSPDRGSFFVHSESRSSEAALAEGIIFCPEKSIRKPDALPLTSCPLTASLGNNIHVRLSFPVRRADTQPLFGCCSSHLTSDVLSGQFYDKSIKESTKAEALNN